MGFLNVLFLEIEKSDTRSLRGFRSNFTKYGNFGLKHHITFLSSKLTVEVIAGLFNILLHCGPNESRII